MIRQFCFFFRSRLVSIMEDSQRKLNDAISGMADNLHRNYLRRIYVRFILLFISQKKENFVFIF